MLQSANNLSPSSEFYSMRRSTSAAVLASCALADFHRRRLRPQHPHRRRKGRRLEAPLRRQNDEWLAQLPKADIAPGWKVENGELVRGTEKGGDIITTDKYGAFEFSVEYNISPGGNSGLMYHVTEDGKLPCTAAQKSKSKTAPAPQRPAKARLALSALQVRRPMPPNPPANGTSSAFSSPPKNAPPG